MGKQIQQARETDFPEVLAFLQAKADLEEFKQQNQELFDTLEALGERYNTALEAAEKVCRAAEVNCGPFDLYQFTTKYSGEKLFNAVGRDKFLELGGAIGSKPTYEIDKSRFEAAVAAKKVSKEIVSQVRTETPNYHKPDKLVLP